MAGLIRGFASQNAEQPWCLYFEDGVLRCHRGAQGFEVFRLQLLPLKGKPGYWEVGTTEFNLHPDQLLGADVNALGELTTLINEILLKDGS